MGACMPVIMGFLLGPEPPFHQKTKKRRRQRDDLLISKTISFQSSLRFLIAFEIFFLQFLLDIMLTNSGLGKKNEKKRQKPRG